jgi:hypothetical protein
MELSPNAGQSSSHFIPHTPAYTVSSKRVLKVRKTKSSCFLFSHPCERFDRQLSTVVPAQRREDKEPAKNVASSERLKGEGGGA